MADRIDPGAVALIVVDVQNDFVAHGGTAWRRGASLDFVPAMISCIEALLTAARASDVPVVHVRTEHDSKVDSSAWRRRLDAASQQGDTVVNCQTGSWGAEGYQIQPHDRDRVAVKHRYSAYSSPDFVNVLAAVDRRSLVFAGVATDICVEGTVRDAVDRDFMVTVVADACGGYSTEGHQAALSRIAQAFGPVIETAEVVAAWSA